MKNCQLCKGTGKIHPLLPDGKVDWTRLVYCKCAKKAGQSASEPLDLDRPDRYVPDNTGLPMLDFPCSYTFRRYEAYTQDNHYLPDIEEPEPLFEPVINQTKALQHQQQKINEHEGQLIHIRQILSKQFKPKEAVQHKGGVEI